MTQRRQLILFHVLRTAHSNLASSHGVSEDRSQGNRVFKSLQINAETYDLCINPLLSNKC